jgi:hypothetical protein
MIVERIVWKAKVGCRDELIKLAKAWLERYGLTGRVCTFDSGDHATVWVNLDFETKEDRETFWANYDWSRPEAIETLEKFQNLLAYEGTHELVRVH